VLKYRLAREDGSTYTVEGTSLFDVQRAIRLVRSRASEWNIKTDRVGVIGFSAGGELAALADTRYEGTKTIGDPVDREDSKPAFAALIYPAIPHDLVLSKTTPPVFLLAGEDDSPAITEAVPALYFSLKRAGVSTEMHILAGAAHGFGMRDSNPPNVKAWPSLFCNWLDAQGFLRKK
jgi:acetyl esterase/lipase